jgi:hypothetical protein
MNWKSRWRRITHVVLILLAVGGCWLGYRLYYLLATVIPDAYCVWNVAGLVIDYMEDHEGHWPRNWDDLRETYDKSKNHAWSFVELKERVSVDWTADPAELSKVVPTEGELPFRVIWANSGSNEYWSLREPNRLVLDYLKENPPASDQIHPNETRIELSN